MHHGRDIFVTTAVMIGAGVHRSMQVYLMLSYVFLDRM